MSETRALPVKHASRNYIVQSALVMGLYLLAFWARPWLAAHAPDHNLALAATLLPILPTWLMIFTVWRYYRRIDEYKQKRFLEVLAISFGASVGVIVTYGILMDVGFPKLDYVWVWPVMGVTWALVSGIHEWMRR